MAGRALVLLAHGAYDARWREPLDRLRERLAAQQLDVGTRLAFLELMASGLPGTITDPTVNGTQSIIIVPVFFGQGGHLWRDLPVLIARCAQAHPALSTRCADAIGKDDAVLDVIAGYCVRQLDQTRRPTAVLPRVRSAHARCS